jgi:hypothetical protein
VVTALAAASVLGATAFAVPASAATPQNAQAARAAQAAQAGPATQAARAAYNGACGAAYTVVDHGDIGTAGTVYLTWNDRTGENCVVTVRTKPGAAVYMQAKVYQTHNTLISASDSGAYTTYAGPAYIPARAECVTWRGQIGSEYVLNTGHCG